MSLLDSLNLRSSLGRKLTWNEMDLNWTNIANFFQPISITYAELTAAITASLLQPGHFYLLTDYATSHYIQYTDSAGDGSALDEEVNTGAVEPLVLLAMSNNTLDLEALSPAYPQDIIHYQVSMADRSYDYAATTGKGCIIKRVDTLLDYSRDYDFRVVKFRRWETVIGNGLYRSYLPVTGAATADYLAQNSTTVIQRSHIYSPLAGGSVLGFVYQLDNVIIQDTVAVFVDTEGKGAYVTFFTGNVVFNSMNVFFKLTFSGNVQANNFTSISNSIFESDVLDNNVLSVSDTHVRSLAFNTGNDIDSCVLQHSGTYYDIFSNDCNNISTCTNQGNISGNVCDSINNNSHAGEITNCVANTISNNTHTGNIINLTVNDCSNNSGTGDIANLVGNVFSNNIMAGDIDDCMGVDISGCTVATDIKAHHFLAAITAKTITGTADMQSATISTVTRYDKGTTEHHEEILTSGAITYSGAVTA